MSNHSTQSITLFLSRRKPVDQSRGCSCIRRWLRRVGEVEIIITALPFSLLPLLALLRLLHTRSHCVRGCAHGEWRRWHSDSFRARTFPDITGREHPPFPVLRGAFPPPILHLLNIVDVLAFYKTDLIGAHLGIVRGYDEHSINSLGNRWW